MRDSVKHNRRFILAWMVSTILFLSGCAKESVVNTNLSTPTDRPAEITPTVGIIPGTATATPVPVDCKKLAIVISKGETSDIYTVCPDGSKLINLTNDAYLDAHPAWSPNGSEIAFVSSRAGDSQIYVMPVDGSSPRQITSDHSNDHPIWLPDGKQIAFRSTDQNGLWWWRIVDLETSVVSEYSTPSYDFFFQTPAWSPDGQSIAYMTLLEQQQRNDGSSQIHVKNIDG
jgi:Tol biopolymer transport system component